MYDCIIPAAGASSRMEAWKPGLAFRGGTLLSETAGIALAAGCRILVVSGNHAEAVPQALGCLVASGAADPAAVLRIIHNPDWKSGMTGSLQAALRSISSRRFFILPADLPFVPVRAFHILALEAEAREAGGLPDRPVFPTYCGRPGHPVLIPASLIPESLGLPAGSRFRDFLDTLGPVYVSVDAPGILADLDTRNEYEAALCHSH